MTNKDYLKEAFKIAWPAILESFFMAFAGLIDSFMVSSLGSHAVAAVGLTTQPKFLGMCMFFATSVAVSALVARRKGEERRDAANVIAITGILYAIVSALIIGLSLCYFASDFMHFCGSTPQTHDMATKYYQIIMAGIVFNAIQLVTNAAQRGVGNTKITMKTNMASNTINIFLNYCLIGGHFGFPAWGIQGAALATVSGSVAGALISISSIIPMNRYISLRYVLKEHIRPTMEAMGHLVKVGYSLFFEQILMRAGFMATALMAADQGDAAMAAHQVGMNILGLTFSFGDGLQAAAVALIGYSLGAKDKERAYAYGKACRTIGMAISVVLALTFYLSARPLYRLFFEEEEIIAHGVNMMYIMIVVCLVQIGQVIYMGCLRGAGDTLYTAIASTICVLFIRTAMSYLGAYILGWGIEGVWLGIFGDQAGRYVFAMTRYRKGKWVDIKI